MKTREKERVGKERCISRRNGDKEKGKNRVHEGKLGMQKEKGQDEDEEGKVTEEEQKKKKESE